MATDGGEDEEQEARALAPVVPPSTVAARSRGRRSGRDQKNSTMRVEQVGERGATERHCDEHGDARSGVRSAIRMPAEREHAADGLPHVGDPAELVGVVDPLADAEGHADQQAGDERHGGRTGIVGGRSRHVVAAMPTSRAGRRRAKTSPSSSGETGQGEERARRSPRPREVLVVATLGVGHHVEQPVPDAEVGEADQRHRGHEQEPETEGLGGRACPPPPGSR